VRRDVERLRDLGYPVEATRGRVGGYRLVGGTAMPPLLLDDDEAMAMTIALRLAVANGIDADRASVRALAKVQQVLPTRLRARVSSLASATSAVAWEPSPVDPERLIVLARATASRERLRFTYEGADARPSERLVEPYGVAVVGRRWYLAAWDLDRADWRTFRVDRILGVRPTPGRFAPRDLPGDDPAAFVRERLESLAPVYEAVAIVEAPTSVVATRLPGEVGRVESLGAGRSRVTLQADTLDWLLWRLTGLDLPFAIVSPPELVAHARAAGRRMREAAGRPSRRATYVRGV
jgi:predicted DNA-binding transcriptional regulator YafY